MDQFNKILIIGLIDNVPIRLVSPEGKVSYYINLKTMKTKFNSGTWIKVYCIMDGEEELKVSEGDVVLISGRLIKRKTKTMDSEGKVIYQFAISCYQNNVWNLTVLVSTWSNDSQVNQRMDLEEEPNDDILSEIERGLV